MSLPLEYPTEDEIRWLVAQGVSETAMLGPPPIRAAKVVFLDKQTFDFDAAGARVLLLTEEHDLIAWKPDGRTLASWRGVAFALGEDAIGNPASYFMGDALWVHRDPLAWLKADREGIVIVQPRFTYAYLRHTPRLAFSSATHARQVQAWLQPPKPKVKFLIKTPEERAAAA